MKRVLRWLGIVAGGIVAVLVVGLAVVYALSARILNRTYAVPIVEAAIAVPSGPAAVAEGRRLATIRGCVTCHGTNLEGDVMIDDPMLARIASPNLSRLVPRYTDAELERLVRHGVRKDGTGIVIMPASMFAALADADLGAIIAYLRSVPPVEHELPARRIGPLGRLGLVLGKFHTEPAIIDHSVPHSAAPPTGDRLAFGRYLALTSCTECHGRDLKGQRDGGPPGPNLAVAAAYSDSAFLTFFRTGNALGNRRLELMSPMTQRRFSRFSDGELGMLLGYLKTLR